jgi:hypothetical protein
MLITISKQDKKEAIIKMSKTDLMKIQNDEPIQNE